MLTIIKIADSSRVKRLDDPILGSAPEKRASAANLQRAPKTKRRRSGDFVVGSMTFRSD
jgi:hypothetical protein